jgi:hypothetical protein
MAEPEEAANGKVGEWVGCDRLRPRNLRDGYGGGVRIRPVSPGLGMDDGFWLRVDGQRKLTATRIDTSP